MTTTAAASEAQVEEEEEPQQQYILIKNSEALRLNVSTHPLTIKETHRQVDRQTVRLK